MGDIYLFYGLARYNDIRVPRQVAAGQSIKVPGKQPPARPVEPAARGKQTAGGKVKETQPPPVQAETPRPDPVPAPVPAPPSAGQKAYERGLQLARSGDKEGAYEAFRDAARLEPQNRDAASQRDQVRQELIQHNTREATVALQRQNVAASIRHWNRVLELDPNNASAKANLERARELEKRLKDFPEKK
jgi:tetratricopeptide (TPR) repeat protein